MTMDWARPYLAPFRARFQLMLQYRAAALAGFATQCWWGGIKIMVFAAFLKRTSNYAKMDDFYKLGLLALYL